MRLNFYLSAWFTVPWIINYFITSSLGSSVLLCLVLMLFLSLPWIYSVKFKVDKNFLRLSVLIFLCIIFSVAISILFYGFPGQTTLASIPIFIIILLSSYILYQKIFDYNCPSLNYPFIILCSLGLLSILGVDFYNIYSGLSRAIFPFFEPSHFSLAYASSLAILLGSKNRPNLMIYFYITIFFAFSFPSASLLLLSFILLLCNGKIKIGITIFVFIVFAVFLFAGYDFLDYFADRAGLNDTNLSGLVYLQGIEQIVISLRETTGFGVGFQRMGAQSPGIYSFEIFDKLGFFLNRNDGGFNAAKILSEFGYLGAVFLVSYLYLLFFSIKFIRQYTNSGLCCFRVMPLYIITFGFVELFARGVGYFSPTFIIFLLALSYCWMTISHLKIITSCSIGRQVMSQRKLLR